MHNHNREWYGFWLWTCAFCFQRNIYFSFNYQTQKEMKKSIDCLRPPPGFVFLALCGWSRKIAPPSESVILKSWSSSRLGHLSFPCFKQFACSYSEFSLANHNFHLCFNWSQLLLWFTKKLLYSPHDSTWLWCRNTPVGNRRLSCVGMQCMQGGKQ